MPSGRTLVAVVESFNKTLRRITMYVANSKPNDAMIQRVRNAMILAIDAMPCVALEKMGPYLDRFAEDIYAKNSSFFLMNSYDAELQEASGSDEAELAAQIIPEVKAIWNKSDENVQADLWKAITSLTNDYIDYLELTA